MIRNLSSQELVMISSISWIAVTNREICLIKVESKHTALVLGFNRNRKNIKSTMAKNWEKRHARATGQTFDTTIKIPHLPVTSLFLFKSINLNFMGVSLLPWSRHEWMRRLSTPFRWRFSRSHLASSSSIRSRILSVQKFRRWNFRDWKGPPCTIPLKQLMNSC